MLLSGTAALSGSLALPEGGWMSATLQVPDPGVGEGMAALAGGGAPTRIDYTYDPLGRLRRADYGNGVQFDYSYDAAGNRTQHEYTLCPRCPTHVVTYAYDIAQRLTGVNGVSYIWDSNGNLLNDGVNTYTYNHANRLTAVSGPSSAVSFGYNGLGDRLQQIAGGVTTRYALDLNNSLSQVLSDGSNTYLYGLDRIGQQNIVGWQYYFGDALGSVRQLANPAGTIIQARNYEAFGKPLGAAGNPLTKYGYTGEWSDATNLIYLRARYYDPATGRFLSKDPVRGLASLPQTLNPYTYAINNPIQYIDPSGKIVWIPAILGIGALVGGKQPM
jgi:RHS repeat-associated protein